VARAGVGAAVGAADRAARAARRAAVPLRAERAAHAVRARVLVQHAKTPGITAHGSARIWKEINTECERKVWAANNVSE